MGSWEAIKMDSSFEIGDKILTNEDKKPQAKHLQSRADYLLKLIKKLLDQKNGKQKQRKPRTKRGNKEPVTKDIVEDDGSSGDEKKTNKTAKNDRSDKVSLYFRYKSHLLKLSKTVNKLVTIIFIFLQGKLKPEEVSTHDETSNDRKDRDKRRTKKDGKDRKVEKTKARKKPAGPMHFTANNEPRALEVLGDLDPSVFEEVCSGSRIDYFNECENLINSSFMLKKLK